MIQRQDILHAISTPKSSHQCCPVLFPWHRNSPWQLLVDLFSVIIVEVAQWIDCTQILPVSLQGDEWDGNRWFKGAEVTQIHVKLLLKKESPEEKDTFRKQARASKEVQWSSADQTPGTSLKKTVFFFYGGSKSDLFFHCFWDTQTLWDQDTAGLATIVTHHSVLPAHNHLHCSASLL